MRTIRKLAARLQNFTTGRTNEERIREEIEEHIALQTAENLRAGMPDGQARLETNGSHNHTVL